MSVVMNFFKYILEYARYKIRFYRTKRYFLLDRSNDMSNDIMRHYQDDYESNRDYDKRCNYIKHLYKKIHILRTSICNIGPLCIYYLYIDELLKKLPKSEKVLLMLYEGDEFLLSENSKYISNKFIYKKISEAVEIIDEKNVSFWAYAIKNENAIFDFDWLMVHYPGLLPHEKVYHVDGAVRPEHNYMVYTLNEENEGKDLLGKLNLQAGGYCCIFSRNNEYYEKYFNNTGSKDAEITSLRNSDLSRFCKAVDALNEYGVASVRVGAVDSRKSYEKMIDYTNTCRSEFGDFFLMGKAKFVIGDNSGILMIPWLQNVPIGVTNNYTILWMVGNELNYNTRQVFTIYKKWYDTKLGRYLTLKEIMEYQRKYGMTDELQIGFLSSLGINFHDNTEDEIADLAIEINLRIDGKWVEKNEFVDLRNKFWEIVNEYIKYSSKYLCLLDYQPGSLFLKRNRWFLD